MLPVGTLHYVTLHLVFLHESNVYKKLYFFVTTQQIYAL